MVQKMISAPVATAAKGRFRPLHLIGVTLPCRFLNLPDPTLGWFGVDASLTLFDWATFRERNDYLSPEDRRLPDPFGPRFHRGRQQRGKRPFRYRDGGG